MRRKVAYRLTDPQLCVLRPCSQSVTVSQQLMWEPDPGIPDCSEHCYHDATVILCGQTQPKTMVSGPTMRAVCFWCSHDSDTDVSVAIVYRWESSSGSTFIEVSERDSMSCLREFKVPVPGSHIVSNTHANKDPREQVSLIPMWGLGTISLGMLLLSQIIVINSLIASHRFSSHLAL